MNVDDRAERILYIRHVEVDNSKGKLLGVRQYELWIALGIQLFFNKF